MLYWRIARILFITKLNEFNITLIIMLITIVSLNLNLWKTVILYNLLKHNLSTDNILSQILTCLLINN